MKHLLPLILFSITLSLLTGCTDKEEEITPNKMKTGKELYIYYCRDCHAKKGPGAYMESFSNRKPMRSYKVILMVKYGYSSTHQMPIFSQFNDKQTAMVAQYVVNLQKMHYEKNN